MKTIKEKARRFDEAIDRAKKWHNAPNADKIPTLSTRVIEEIFPELKESEDERIRQFLYHTFTVQYLAQDKLGKWHGESVSNILAWLEKQGEQSNWKPSKDEMDALYGLAYITNKMDDKKDKAITKLYQDLKMEFFNNASYENMFPSSPVDSGINVEKQCEQKTTIEMKTPEESLGIDSDTYNKIVDECIYGEQKPIKEHNACEFCEDRYGCVNPCSMKLIEKEKHADEIKPKFHEGDWVVYCNDDVDLITGIEENGYSINNGGYIPFICENEMRLWDITDAKVGDVLVSESTCGLGTWYCIFKSLDGDESMTVYCYLTRDGRFETKKELCFDKDPYNTKPATKEQRNTLLKAMSDAGYTFDFEKKELKKIEQLPIDVRTTGYWHVEDVEQKSAWSEEDEKMLNSFLHKLEVCDLLSNKECLWIKNKLKALKQNTWKPSGEQMKALEHFVRSIGESGYASPYDNDTKLLYSLLFDLKKLREK